MLDIVPGVSQELSWTIVLQAYMIVSCCSMRRCRLAQICYIMFHYVTGTPFDAHSGAFDELTLWEQIDSGAQYTPAKKWLTSLPIVLFLLSTHYSRYDRHPTFFTFNLLSLVSLGLAPKLPFFHRIRIRFFQNPPLTRHNSTSGLHSPTVGRSSPPTPIAEEPETPVRP